MVPPQDTTVLIGETAVFTCVATAEPEHTVVWRFNEVLLSDGSKYSIVDVNETTSVLNIRNVSLADEGRYTCMVVNPHGMDMDSAMLTVHCKSGMTTTFLYSHV